MFKQEKTKENCPTIYFEKEGKKQYLHSKFFPSRDQKLLENKKNEKNIESLIILGCGLGYHLIPLFENPYLYKKIYILDNNPNLLEDLAKNPFLAKKPDNLKFIFNKEVSPLLEDFQKDFLNLSSYEIFQHPACQRIFPEFYQTLELKLQQLLENNLSKKSTLNAFAPLYFKNSLKHLNNLKELKNAQIFTKQFKDYPVMIISSAPSLNNAINFIAHQQKKFFIIAVDSALTILLEHQIEPDFVITIDPQAYVQEHYFNNYQGIILTPLSATFLNKKNTYLYLNSHPLSQLLDQLYPQEFITFDTSSGTVAGDAISAALNFGFKTIYLIGVDFCFSQQEIYAKDTTYQNRYATILNNRYQNIETLNMNYITRGKKYIVENKRTRNSFVFFRDKINKLCFKKNNIYNLGNGLNLSNVPQITVKEITANLTFLEISKKDVLQKLALNQKINLNFDLLKKTFKDQKVKEMILQESFEKDEQRMNKYLKFWNN